MLGSRAAQLALVLLLLAVPDGLAAERPPVVFVDERPLTVDLGVLREHGALDVAVRNTSDAPQMASVRVVNLAAASGETDPLIEKLFQPQGAAATIPAGTEKVLMLPLQLPPGTTPAPRELRTSWWDLRRQLMAGLKSRADD